MHENASPFVTRSTTHFIWVFILQGLLSLSVALTPPQKAVGLTLSSCRRESCSCSNLPGNGQVNQAIICLVTYPQFNPGDSLILNPNLTHSEGLDQVKCLFHNKNHAQDKNLAYSNNLVFNENLGPNNILLK